MSDPTVMAEAISKKLHAVAAEISATPGPSVDKAALIDALNDPWVCVEKPGSQQWHLFNTLTGEWGDPC